MRDGALLSVGVGDDQRRRGGGVAGRWRGALSWLRRVAGAVGLGARAGGAPAGWGPPFVAAASRVLQAVSDHARAFAVVVGATSARWRGGDRPGAGAQGRRARASEDRRAAWASAGHGPWLAARGSGPRRGAASLRGTGPVGPDRRCSTRSRRSAARRSPGGCVSTIRERRRGRRSSSSPAGCCMVARAIRPATGLEVVRAPPHELADARRRSLIGLATGSPASTQAAHSA